MNRILRTGCNCRVPSRQLSITNRILWRKDKDRNVKKNLDWQDHKGHFMLQAIHHLENSHQRHHRIAFLKLWLGVVVIAFVVHKVFYNEGQLTLSSGFHNAMDFKMEKSNPYGN